MIIGRISGSIHSTIHHPFYQNRKLLLVDMVDTEGKPTGDYLIAIDMVDAGAGELVLVIDEGNSARQIVSESNAPVRSIIIGVIDEIHLHRIS